MIDSNKSRDKEATTSPISVSDSNFKTKMEAVFYSLYEIEAADLIDNDSDILENNTEATALFKRLIKSASQLALNNMPNFMRRRTLNTGNLTVDTAMNSPKKSVHDGRVMSLSNFYHGMKAIGGIMLHQTSVISSGLTSIYKGDRRPTWDIVSHFTFNWLRNTIKYSGHNIQAIRKGEEFGNLFLNFLPKGVKIEAMDFCVNRAQLLWYEKAGMLHQQKTETWRYPVPSEYPDHYNERVSITGEWITPELTAHYTPSGHRVFNNSDHSPRKVILYLHGGAYILGSAKIYRPLTSLLAKESGHPVLSINYRRAPEFPFPAGLHDAFAAYLWLLKPNHPMFGEKPAFHEPYKPQNIIISGDSAGGGLVLALLNYLNMYIKNEDGSHIIPLPRAAALFSPWVDLSCSSKSWLENSGLDFLPANASNLHAPILPNLQHPVYSYCFGERGGRYIDILSPKSSKPTNRIPSIGANLSALSELALPQPLLRMTDNTFVEKDQEWVKSKLRSEEKDALERFVRHPLVSPIFGDFTNMPPMLVQVGECELLRDENLALAFRYQSANKKSESSWIRHELYKDMIHNFQLGSIWIPQAKLAIRSFSNFVANVYGDSETPPSLNFEEQNMIQIIDSRFEKKKDI